jgi:chromosome partitioning protein
LGLEEDDSPPRIEQFLGRVDRRPVDALSDLDLNVGGGRLALLPTAYEALRRQTARLLERGNRDLADLLEALRDEFDLALIDTPAGDTVFGRQALVAADEVVVPILPGYQELRALTRVLDVLDERAGEEATRVRLLGVLVVNADRRWRTTKEYGAHLAAMARDEEIELFDVMVPRHQPVTEHARYGRPTTLLRPRSTVAHAYRALAREIVERLDARHAAERSR